MNIFHIHFYKYKFQAGVNYYYECRCGKRNVCSAGGGYSPIDREWVSREKKNYKRSA